MGLGLSILRIKDQEGKRTVTYLTAIVVHWVMWSTWCALDGCKIRLLFLLSTSITGRSTSWMSSCPFPSFLIQVQEIEPSVKYCIDVPARCKASEPCLSTYCHWAFLSLWKHLLTAKVTDRSAKRDIQLYERHRSGCQCKKAATAVRPPAATYAVPAGQADPAPRHGIHSNSAMKQLLGWHDRDTSCVPATLNNWLYTCSHGTNARKESYICNRRWRLDTTKEPIWPKCEQIYLPRSLKLNFSNT